MNEQDLREKYGAANDLYKGKRYTESLAILNELDVAFPDNPDLLYARALCLTEMGRLNEAMDVCGHLIRECSSARGVGVDLMSRIAARMADAAEHREEEQANLPTATEVQESTQRTRVTASQGQEVLREGAPADVAEHEAVQAVRESAQEAAPYSAAPAEEEELSTGEEEAPSPDAELVAEDDQEPTQAAEIAMAEQPETAHEAEVETVEELTVTVEAEAAAPEETPPYPVVLPQIEPERPQREEMERPAEIKAVPSERRNLRTVLLAGLIGAVAIITALYLCNGPTLIKPAPSGEGGIPPPSPVSPPKPPPAKQVVQAPPLVFPYAARDVAFPADRVLGRLSMRPWDSPDDAPWEELADAAATVSVPEGKELRLVIREYHWLDLDALAALELLNLRRLDIANSGLTNESLAPVARFKALRSIALDHTFQITDVGLAYLGGLDELRSVTLRGVNMASDAALSAMGPLKNLRSLDIAETSFSNAALKYVAGATTLDALDLPDRVTDAGLEQLGTLCNLKHLGLGVGVSGEGLDRLAQFSVLEELVLRGDITPAGLKHVAEHPSLRRVALLGDIEPAGLAQLSVSQTLRGLRVYGVVLKDRVADALAGFSGIETLELDSPSFEKGGQYLASALKKLPALKQLVISRGSVEAGVQEKLRSALPNCTVTIPQPQEDTGRRIAFPLGSAQGVLYQRDRSSTNVSEWQILGRATGLVPAPREKVLMLEVNGESEPDLVFLEELRPDDLQALSLTNSTINDTALVHLARLTGLETLTVASPNVTDVGLRHLSSMRALKKLDLTGTSVTAAGIESLRKTLRNCEVLLSQAQPQ